MSGIFSFASGPRVKWTVWQVSALTQNAISFCQIGVRAASVVIIFDGISVALNCQLVCVGRGVSVTLLCQPHSPLPSYSPGPRHQTPASLIPSLNPTLGSDPSCREKVPDRLVTIPQNPRCVSCHQLRRSHHFNTRRDSSPASENWINVRVKRDLVLGNRITVSFSAQWSSSSGRCTNFGYFKYFKVAKITRKWTL